MLMQSKDGENKTFDLRTKILMRTKNDSKKRVKSQSVESWLLHAEIRFSLPLAGSTLMVSFFGLGVLVTTCGSAASGMTGMVETCLVATST